MIVDKQEFLPLKVTNVGIIRLNPGYKEDLYNLIPFSDSLIPMRDTGLNDACGVEIFEGDIVLELTSGEVGKVYWFKEYASFYWGAAMSLAHNTELKVIGNIYQNPEKLED
jgi:hypothetical protein